MVWPNSFWIEFLHNTYFRSNAIIVQSSLLGTLHSKVQQMQNCSKHFMKRTVWNSANASCDFSWNMVISLKLLSLNATLSFGKMKESHGVILREKGECVTSHCLQTQIHTHTHTDKVQWLGAFSWWRNQSPKIPIFSFFPSHIFPQMP